MSITDHPDIIKEEIRETKREIKGFEREIALLVEKRNEEGADLSSIDKEIAGLEEEISNYKLSLEHSEGELYWAKKYQKVVDECEAMEFSSEEEETKYWNKRISEEGMPYFAL